MAPPAPGTIQKVTYEFADPEDLLPSAAWSETFYVAGDLNSVFEQVTDPADWAFRLDILHPNYAIAAITVSDVVVLRDSSAYAFSLATGRGTFPAPIGFGPKESSEEPWDGVLVSMQNLALNSRRSTAMRGLPTDVVVDNFRYVGNAQWNPRFDAWVARHTTSPGEPGPATPYLLQKRDFTPMAAPDTITIGADSRSLVLTWTAGVPAALQTQFNIVNGPGAFIELKNVFGANHVNTIWRITRLAAVGGVVVNTAYTIRHKGVIFSAGLTGAWTIRLVGYTYPPIAYMTPLRGAKRNTGGPSKRLAGKARTR